MKRILLVNACARPGSRTMELAREVLKKVDGTVEELRLYDVSLSALDLVGMEKRGQAAQNRDFSHTDFDLAKQFAAADVIVIAAPYWDMMFPAILKTYLENITVSGVTFRYSDRGIPESLCNAKSLYYVTTSGGYIGENDFGFVYVNALAQNFFGIADVKRYTAEGLDIYGADVASIMEKAKLSIVADFQ